jgi:hypothetical protein
MFDVALKRRIQWNTIPRSSLASLLMLRLSLEGRTLLTPARVYRWIRLFFEREGGSAHSQPFVLAASSHLHNVCILNAARPLRVSLFVSMPTVITSQLEEATRYFDQGKYDGRATSAHISAPTSSPDLGGYGLPTCLVRRSPPERSVPETLSSACPSPPKKAPSETSMNTEQTPPGSSSIGSSPPPRRRRQPPPPPPRFIERVKMPFIFDRDAPLSPGKRSSGN